MLKIPTVIKAFILKQQSLKPYTTNPWLITADNLNFDYIEMLLIRWLHFY